MYAGECFRKLIFIVILKHHVFVRKQLFLYNYEVVSIQYNFQRTTDEEFYKNTACCHKFTFYRLNYSFHLK